MTNKTVSALTKKRVAGFVRDNSSFTESQVRWWIFHAEENGLANFGAVHRVGRTVWIDELAFFAWMESDPPGRNQYVEREAKSGLTRGGSRRRMCLACRAASGKTPYRTLERE